MYRELGYFLAPNLIDKKEIIDLREKMTEVFQIYTKDYDTEFNQLIIKLFAEDQAGFIGCANICQNMVELLRLSTDSRILQTLQSLGLEFPCVNTRPLVSFSSPFTAKNVNYWKVPAHQDWPSTQGSLNGVTCWIPLIDVTEFLGPLEICPKSHLNGYLEHEEVGVPKLIEEYQCIPIPMNCGDALFFSNFTIHKSGVNSSKNIRWTVHFRYDDIKEQTFIDRKYPRHRIDQRKEGILFPGFPTQEQLNAIF